MTQKYFFCLILSLLFQSLSYAQDHSLRIEYNSLMRIVQESPTPYQAQLTLQIDGNQSLFYQKNDTLESMFKGHPPIIRVHPQMIKKNFPQDGVLTFKDELSRIPFYYTEPIPNFDWDLLEEDSLICEYPCKKAKTTFRGRTWIVWYTEEIPISDGPWKLCGLPGLILKAIDSKGDFSFSAYKITHQPSDKNVKFSLKNYKKTTPQQYAKDVVAYRKDREGWEESVTGKRQPVVIMDGKRYKSPSETACLMEYFDEE